MRNSINLLFKTNTICHSTPYLRKNITSTEIKKNIKYKANKPFRSSYSHMYNHLPIKSFKFERNTKKE